MTFFLVCVIVFLFFSNAIGWSHAKKRKEAIIHMSAIMATLVKLQTDVLRDFKVAVEDQAVEEFKKQLDEMD